MSVAFYSENLHLHLLYFEKEEEKADILLLLPLQIYFVTSHTLTNAFILLLLPGNRFECNCHDSLWLFLLPEQQKNRIEGFSCVNSDEAKGLNNLTLADLQCY